MTRIGVCRLTLRLVGVLEYDETMTKRYSAAELEKMSAAERAEVIKDAVVTDPDQVDQELLARGRERLAGRFSELAG